MQNQRLVVPFSLSTRNHSMMIANRQCCTETKLNRIIYTRRILVMRLAFVARILANTVCRIRIRYFDSPLLLITIFGVKEITIYAMNTYSSMGLSLSLVSPVLLGLYTILNSTHLIELLVVYNPHGIKYIFDRN